MRERIFSLLSILLILLVASCASLGTGRSPASVSPPAASWPKPTPVNPYQQSAAYTAFSMAQFAMMAGNSELAYDLLKHAITLDPNSAFLYAVRGGIEIKDGLLPAAHQSLTEALALDPDNLSALRMMPGLLVALGREAEAVAYYEKLIRVDPDSLEAMANLAELHIRQQDLKRTEAVVEQMVERFPNESLVHLWRGKFQMLRQQNELAEQSFVRALELDPESEDAFAALGALYEIKGDLIQAIEFYENNLDRFAHNLLIRAHLVTLYMREENWEKAEEENGRLALYGYDEAFIVRNRGLIALGQKQDEQAAVWFGKVLELEPQDDTSRYYQGTILLRQQKYEQAREVFSQVPEDSSIYPDALFGLSLLHRELKQYQQAVDYLQTALELAPGDIVYQRLLALCWSDLGQLDRAEKLLIEVIEKAPDDLSLRFTLGLVYEKSKKHLQGVEQMKLILDREPDNADAHNYIGYSYAVMGIRFRDAQKHLDAALVQKPDDPYIVDSYGWLYYKMGQTELALEKLLWAAERLSDEAVVLQHVGEVYLALGRVQDAVTFFEKALSATSDPQLKEELIDQIRMQEQ